MLVNLASVCYLTGFVMIPGRVFYLNTGLNELYIKGHVNPKIHVFLILCKKWRRERI